MKSAPHTQEAKCIPWTENPFDGWPLYGVDSVGEPEGREIYWRDLWEADMAFVMKKHFFEKDGEWIQVRVLAQEDGDSVEG